MKDLILNIFGNWAQYVELALIAIGALSAFLLALYNIFLLIPGEQPDLVIKKIYDFTVKYSKKADEAPKP